MNFITKGPVINGVPATPNGFGERTSIPLIDYS